MYQEIVFNLAELLYTCISHIFFVYFKMEQIFLSLLH